MIQCEYKKKKCIVLISLNRKQINKFFSILLFYFYFYFIIFCSIATCFNRVMLYFNFYDQKI